MHPGIISFEISHSETSSTSKKGNRRLGFIEALQERKHTLGLIESLLEKKHDTRFY